MFGLDFIGGLADDLFTGGKGDKAVDYAGQGRKAFEDLNPNVDIVQQGSSAYDSADPTARAAQMDALSQLQNAYRQGGLSAIDRARMGDIQDQAAGVAKTAQAGVAQDAMRRGLYNSGNALVAQQVAGQGAAQAGAAQARDVAGAAQQARLNEISGAGQLAGGVRGQDYERAAAQDAISRFNAANKQGQLQNNYGNALNRASGISGTFGHQADLEEANADRTSGETGKIIKSIPGLGNF